MKISEKKLVEKLSILLKKEFSTNQSFFEINVGYGRADLVFTPNYRFRKTNFNKRSPITDFAKLQLLLELKEGESYDLENLYEQFNFLSKQALRKVLQSLVQDRALEKVSKNKFKKNTSLNQLDEIPEIIAIEAKLTDFKNGLIQARRYKYFADKVYLAILSEAKEKIDEKQFQDQNIGLIYFDQSSNSVEVIHPKNENHLFEKSISLFAREIIIEKYLF
jgi:hypothetical protein